MAMGSRATNGGLSADDQLPGLPSTHYKTLHYLIHPTTSLLAAPEMVTQQGLIALLILQTFPPCHLLLTNSLSQHIAELCSQRVEVRAVQQKMKMRFIIM
jgi:hypothetical protein